MPHDALDDELFGRPGLEDGVVHRVVFASKFGPSVDHLEALHEEVSVVADEHDLAASGF